MGLVLSYNNIVSKYIANYINTLKKVNKLEEVSYQGFLTFINNTYKQILIDKKILTTI